jgi:hypothetical protein
MNLPQPPEPSITKITIGRLYYLGSYEHIRYELSVEVPEGSSASKALVGMEKLLHALAPEGNSGVKSEQELQREYTRILDLQKELTGMGPEKFRLKHGYFVGTPTEYLDCLTKALDDEHAKRNAYLERFKKARALLDDLGGASAWKDAKLSRDNENDDWDA